MKTSGETAIIPRKTAVVPREFGMQSFQRTLNIFNLLKKKSYFLLGPRATGKTSLIAAQLPHDVPLIDLLSTQTYLQLETNPSLLESIIFGANTQATLAVIDEVQRIPNLLNEVHRLIEKKKLTFLLTGSSARKLKHNQANLLAGRARQAELFPLTSHEIPDFDLYRYLQYGGLPVVYQSDEPWEDLLAYVNTYLKEEIQAEAAVRQLASFNRFLKFSALTSGHILNFANLSNDAMVPASTIRDYYTILEETLIGFQVPAWQKKLSRKAMSKSKFYYFDLGVKNVLANITALPPASDLFGQAFEHFIALELRAYLSYRRLHLPLSYWQATDHTEVDFIIGDRVAIEVKATTKMQEKHLKGLKLLVAEKACEHYILVTQDALPLRIGKIDVMPWQWFLKKLWANEIKF